MKTYITILFSFFIISTKGQDTTKHQIKVPQSNYNFSKLKFTDLKNRDIGELNSLYFSQDIFHFGNNSYICGYGFYSPIEGSEAGVTFCIPIRNKKNR